MPQIDHVGAGEILGMWLMHQVMFATHFEAEPVIALLVHRPEFLDQCDHIHPFEIVRRRMSEQGFEGPKVCAV